MYSYDAYPLHTV